MEQISVESALVGLGQIGIVGVIGFAALFLIAKKIFSYFKHG